MAFLPLEQSPRGDCDAGSSEEELVAGEARRAGVRRAFIAAAGLLWLVGACILAAKAVSSASEQRLRAPHPVTARALLESPGLADLVTDNLMAVGGAEWAAKGDEWRREVRATVAMRLLNISGTIQRLDPAAHRQLEELVLSPAQQAKVYKTLSHFSDKRVRELSSVVAHAVQQTAREKDDVSGLKRRLLETLAPRATEIEGLARDLFPDRAAEFNINFVGDDELTSEYHDWHLKVQLPAPEHVYRRLSPDEHRDISMGTDIQAQSMFSQLSEEFGPAMPPSPARLLQEQIAEGQNPGFLSCMMQEMKSMDLPGCVSCVIQNVKSLMHMVEGFLMPK